VNTVGTAPNVFTVTSENAVYRTRATGTGYLGVETLNSSGARVSYAILGVRGPDGFLQGQSNTFRIETVGGTLADLQVRQLQLLFRTPSGDSLGAPGEICIDSNYIYVCVEDGSWKRAELSSF
jgi:hypothetical protein